MRPITFAFLLLCFAAGAVAQAPVPIGGLTIPVEVRSRDLLLPGVTVEATSEGGRKFSAVTDAGGRARIAVDAPGRYVVRALAKGAATEDAAVDVGIGGASTVVLHMGPVPIGGGPSPSDRCSVKEESFADAASLQHWLDSTHGDRCELTAIVYESLGSGYFAFRGVANAPQYFVLDLSGALSEKTLADELAVRPSMTFRGALRVRSRQTLLVFTK